jgi:hypothetical protein
VLDWTAVTQAVIGLSCTGVGGSCLNLHAYHSGFTRSHETQQIEHTMLFGIERRSLLSPSYEADGPPGRKSKSIGDQMIRALALSTIATAGFALPALADNSPEFNSAQTAAFSAELQNEAVAQQARLQLAREGYTGISALQRDETGRWTGIATKNGKIVFVAVILPHIAHHATTN